MNRFAACQNCQSIFEYELRDRFKGEVFCSGCMTRVEIKDQSSAAAAADRLRAIEPGPASLIP